MRYLGRKSLILFALLQAFPYGRLLAQVDRSTVTGTVRDQDGGIVPGVSIVATRQDNGLSREVKTGPNGSYTITGLPVGNYQIVFCRDGFATLRFTAVEQSIGVTRTLNVALTVAQRSDTLTIPEPPTQLDQTTASLGGRTEKQQVTELPLNGRNWYSLTALAPGAIDSGSGNMKSVRFAGRGLDDNNFTLDGVDATGIINSAQRGQGRMTIPLDSIAEFRVESALYTAELGGANGGQVSITSPSGSNNFHGGAYEYFRNDVLNARSPFDPSSAPPFRLNQFGGSAGGPVVRDRTFFFANFEGYRQRLGQTITGFVPSDSFRQSVSAKLSEVISAFPKANRAAVDANTGTYVFQGSQKVDENTGMLRLDHRFNNRFIGYLRYNQDEAVSNVPTGAIGLTQAVDTQPVNGAAQLLQVLSPALTNESKFGFNQEITHTRTISRLAYTVSAPGFSSITNGNTKDERGATLSGTDNLNWVHGRHLVKSGAEVRYVEMNQGNSFTGTLTYSTLANFAANNLDKATQTAALPMKHERKNQVFSFIQDEYKPQPGLTINLGLRYEFYNVFHELDNRAIPFDFNTCGPSGYCPKGSDYTFPNKLNIDPRLAIAWSPAGLKGDTVFRAGGGIYHGDGQLDDQNLPIANDVQRYSLTRATLPALSYPVDPFLAQASGVITPRLLDRSRKDEYVSQWGASIQRKLTSGIVGTVSYIGSKGTHVLTTSYVNGLIPGTATRPFPAFGIVEYRGNNSNTSFQGMQWNLQRSYRNGLLFSANYLWSHSINDGATGGGEAVFPQNINCRACDRASSDQDVRSVFNATAVYLLTGLPGRLKPLFGNWQLSGIVTARTGLPVNVIIDRGSSDLVDGYTTNQRPDLVSGASASQSLNPASFTTPAKGSWGNAGRNIARARGVWQSDASLSRKISLSERFSLQLRAEVFNVFNRAQYGAPQADISAATFGRITTLVNNGPTGTGTPRQFQLALRLGF